MKKSITIERSILFFLGTLILTHLLGIVWLRGDIFGSCQPNAIKYGPFDPYCISIIKERRTFSSKYVILVAKKLSPSYGHELAYPEPYITNEQDIQNTKIDWKNDGVGIETHSNTKIFIPKENFIGGR